MAYISLKLPAGTSSRVEAIVRGQIDPLFADVHSMMRLPIQEVDLNAGCNFSATLVILELIAGVSVELYERPDLDRKDPRDQRKLRFKQLLDNHYPWNEERSLPGAITDEQASNILYEAFRNPLAHRLGIYDGGHSLGTIKIAKGPLSEPDIEAIEQAESRPANWTGPTLFTDGETKSDRTKTVLRVKSLYWGARRMIWNMVSAQALDKVKNNGNFKEDGIPLSTTATGASISSMDILPWRPK